MIRALRFDDVGPVAAAQARAFYDDPLQMWSLPDDSTRLGVLNRLFELMVRVVSVPLGEAYTDDTRSVAALWAPPGRWMVEQEMTTQLDGMVAIVGDGLGRMRRCWEAMAAVHPFEDHFYLSGLGTDPPRQGQGLGSAALAPVLARCDEEGIPAYLESSKERNVGFYARHGFELKDTIAVPPDGPTLWTMWRRPATAAQRS